MSKFSDVLSALGLAPKNLDEARAALTPAKATLDSVSALFAAADLNLEQMLAAGPDALKLHLESISGDDEALAEALLENEQLDNKLALALATAEAARLERDAFSGCLKVLGLEPNADEPLTAESLRSAFDSHVAKQAALALAKHGHPGVKHEPAGAESAPTMTRAEWDKLTPAAKSAHFRTGGRLTD